MALLGGKVAVERVGVAKTGQLDVIVGGDTVWSKAKKGTPDDATIDAIVARVAEIVNGTAPDPAVAAALVTAPAGGGGLGAQHACAAVALVIAAGLCWRQQ